MRTAAWSGLRAGELGALRVKDLDTNTGRLRIRQSVAEVHGVAEFGPVKTYERRTVPIPEIIVGQLVNHVTGRSGEDLVFTSLQGKTLRHSVFYQRNFRPAVASADVWAVTFHDLRHTAAALMIEQGAHPKAIMERLGHSSIRITLDTYGQMFPSLEQGLTEDLNARLAVAMGQNNLTRPPHDPQDGSS